MPYEQGPLSHQFEELATGNAPSYEELRRELAELISISHERWRNFDAIKDGDPKTQNARVELHGSFQKMFVTLEKIGKILGIEPDDGEGSGSIEIGEEVIIAIIEDPDVPDAAKPGWNQALLQYQDMCSDKDGLMWFISEAQACIKFRGAWDEMDAQLRKTAAEKKVKKYAEDFPDDGADSFRHYDDNQSAGLDTSGEEPQVDPENQTGQKKIPLDPKTLRSTKDLPIVDWSKLPEPQT